MLTPAATLDQAIGFTITQRHARGRLVRLGPVLDAVLAAHAYPPAIERTLASALVLAALLGSTLKEEGGQLTLQAQTDNGVISLLVADYKNGDLRGYAKFDAERLAELGPDPSLFGLFGKGFLAITFDLAETGERYQGIVALEGTSLSECAHNYFRQSEQIATAIQLTAEWVAGVWRAGALMLQHEPGGGGYDRPLGRDALPDTPGAGLEDQEANEDWRRAVILMSSVSPTELLDPTLGSDDLLFRLFHGESVRVHASRPLAFGCRCSRARVESTLKALPRDEIKALNIDGRVVVTCQFCNKSESFGDIDLDAIYAA